MHSVIHLLIDMARLDESRLSGSTGDRLERNFYARAPEKRRPAHLRSKEWEAKERERSRIGNGPKQAVHQDHKTDVVDEKDNQTHSSQGYVDGLPLPVTTSHTVQSLPSQAHSPTPTIAVRHDALTDQPDNSEARRLGIDKYKKKYTGNADGGKVWSEEDGKAYDQSLVRALSNTFLCVV